MTREATQTPEQREANRQRLDWVCWRARQLARNLPKDLTLVVWAILWAWEEVRAGVN